MQRGEMLAFLFPLACPELRVLMHFEYPIWFVCTDAQLDFIKDQPITPRSHEDMF